MHTVTTILLILGAIIAGLVVIVIGGLALFLIIALFRGALGVFAQTWLYMLDPPLPWKPRRSGERSSLPLMWIMWLVGWTWMLAGMFFGAFIAPLVIRRLNVAGIPYEEALVIGFSVLVGLAVQFVGWMFVVPASSVWSLFPNDGSIATRFYQFEAGLLLVLMFLIPFVGLAFAFYRYFNTYGPDQGLVTTGVVGALLVKVVVVPVIKGVAAGAVGNFVRKVLTWIRKHSQGD